jgi:Methylase involved in ubiquinone/menaquinone biosynthesis
MNLLEKIHGSYVYNRRVRVLTRELSALLPANGQVLDVGCGDGLLAALMQKEKPNVVITGIDVLVRDQTHIPVVKFDGTTIPFADRSFDTVVFVDVLHHTNDPVLLLREAARVARNTIVIKDHTLDGFAAGATLRFMDRIGNRRYNVALPYNYWPKQEWLNAFEALSLTLRTWKSKLDLYPRSVDWFVGRSLHFIAQTALPQVEAASDHERRS